MNLEVRAEAGQQGSYYRRQVARTKNTRGRRTWIAANT